MLNPSRREGWVLQKEGVTLNRTAFSFLVKQLADLQEHIPIILDEYFANGLDANQLKRRGEIESILEKYLNSLDILITKAQVTDCNTVTLPFVVMGSTVTLENVGSGRQYEFMVVTPDQIDRQAGKISFLSPLGKALLLKKPGNQFEIQVPRGTINYKVLNIQY
jgi:transcription elongation factor GreA